MNIALVFVTYNRLHYTRLALASVLADPDERFSLTIWDNASTDGTVEYLKREVNDSRISDIIFSKENVGQIEAVNQVWGQSKADLLGKLDNDCLVKAGWTRKITAAHRDIDNLGVVACWNFFPDEFDYERAKHKIQTIGEHRILRHPWTCGTGFLIKRETYKRFGPIRGKSTTSYWLRIAKAGYINGWYYPLIYQEHMDDLRSQYSKLGRLPFEEAFKFSPAFQEGTVKTLEQYVENRNEIIRNILEDPFDPTYYTGLRARTKKFKNKLKRVLHRARKTGLFPV